MILSLWVVERIPIDRSVQMTWPEIMFYLDARNAGKEPAKNIPDCTERLMENMERLKQNTDRTSFGLHEVI